MKILTVFAIVFCCSLSVLCQSVVVQPGAPGQATKILPSATNAKIPAVTKADVEFMQGMIHHHQQAVDMVALMKGRTNNADLLRLGARISHTQAEEIKFMKRWLTARGQKTSMQMPKMKMSKHKRNQMMMMPGMLTPKQMVELADTKGKGFDKLFLTGMIQHHGGALTMVYDLFKVPGAGQDAEMFTFATDIDSGQRAEIRIMQNMLKE